MSKVSDQKALILGTSPSSIIQPSEKAFEFVSSFNRAKDELSVFRAKDQSRAMDNTRRSKKKCQMCLTHAFIGNIYSKSLKGSQLAVITLSF